MALCTFSIGQAGKKILGMLLWEKLRYELQTPRTQRSELSKNIRGSNIKLSLVGAEMDTISLSLMLSWIGCSDVSKIELESVSILLLLIEWVADIIIVVCLEVTR